MDKLNLTTIFDFFRQKEFLASPLFIFMENLYFIMSAMKKSSLSIVNIFLYASQIFVLLFYTQLYSLEFKLCYYSVPCFIYRSTGVFNVLSSRANLHLSYNPAGRMSLQITKSSWIH